MQADPIPLVLAEAPVAVQCVLCGLALLDGELVDCTGLAHAECARREFESFELDGPRLDGRDY